MMADPSEVLWRRQKEAPVNLEAIASDLAIPVYYEAMSDDIAGKITRDRGSPSQFSISINSTHHFNRQRFTLAHELAHFIMHRDLIKTGVVDNVMYRSGLSDMYEIQANRRAAEIIMPAGLVRKEWDASLGAESMARKFDVSLASMEIRLKSLRLMD